MVKVEVIRAYVDGKGPGSIVSVDEKMANYLEKIGYGKRVETEEKPEIKAETEEPKPKRKTAKKQKEK